MNEENKYNPSDFDEYIRQGEPDTQQKAYNWQTAIGLQAVDGLRTSDYLLQTARQHIEGQIDMEEVQVLLKSYYQNKSSRLPDEQQTEEADRVAANITRILSTRTLAFNTNGYVALHRQIFEGVFKFAGQIRDYDISKKEWVLRGDTVSYLNYQDLRAALDYDIQQERDFDYSGLNMQQIVSHIARFVAGLWQIHAFGEGNTRTTAVFTIQYLRSIGFDINNSLFARHSWYFRNALVRANYKNAQRGIMYDFSFLEKFFRNLLLGEDNELKNRTMVIEAPEVWETTSAATEQAPNKYRTSTEQVRCNGWKCTPTDCRPGQRAEIGERNVGRIAIEAPSHLPGKLFGTCTEKRMRVYALPRIAQASKTEIQTDSQGAGCLE